MYIFRPQATDNPLPRIRLPGYPLHCSVPPMACYPFSSTAVTPKSRRLCPRQRKPKPPSVLWIYAWRATGNLELWRCLTTTCRWAKLTLRGACLLGVINRSCWSTVRHLVAGTRVRGLATQRRSTEVRAVRVVAARVWSIPFTICATQRNATHNRSPLARSKGIPFCSLWRDVRLSQDKPDLF